jgi:hypothetical protein
MTLELVSCEDPQVNLALFAKTGDPVPNGESPDEDDTGDPVPNGTGEPAPAPTGVS